jgi:hypothetical protein
MLDVDRLNVLNRARTAGYHRIYREPGITDPGSNISIGAGGEPISASDGGAAAARDA